MRCAPATLFVRLIIAIISLGASGCDRREYAGGAPASSGLTADGAVERAELRIVSLSPAISRTLMDFGVEPLIIGRTPHCSMLNPSIPVVGDLLNLDYEQLVRLRPTHVLVQPPATGIDPALVTLAEEQGWTIGAWTLNGIDDIQKLIGDLPGTLCAEDSPRLEELTQRSAAMLNDLAQALSPGGEHLWRGRTLMVNTVDPVMAFGRMTYLHDVLVGLGAENASTDSGWVSLSLEDVVRLDPAAIIVVEPGGAADEDVALALGPLAKLPITAVREHRVAVLRHPDSFLPASSLTGVAGELRAILKKFEAGPQP